MSMESCRKMETWFSTSTVRAAPRKVLSECDLAKGQLFPVGLLPFLSHPYAADLSQQQIDGVLARKLMSYLDFTDHLEHHFINHIAYMLGNGSFDFGLSSKARRDAYKIYVDEAYHSLCSFDLKEQVQAVTGITHHEPHPPLFMRKFEQLCGDAPAEWRDLIKLFFVAVSETLISGSLAKIPRDRRVIEAVRSVVADHCQDEAVHHVYFSKLFTHIWPTLTYDQQCYIGALLPQLIYCFLQPDKALAEEWLMAVGVGEGDARIMVGNSYKEATMAKSMRDDAAATLRLFRKNGLFENKEIYMKFVEFNLLEGAHHSARPCTVYSGA